MSYEGSMKILCKQGHLSVYDAYTSPNIYFWTCPFCRSSAAWFTDIDETNGSDEKTGLCPGDVKLRIRKRHECQCKCGHKHSSEPVQYFIPKKGKKSNENS
jgi:hypothetical protein